MHDIDRAMFELSGETGETGYETYELQEAAQEYESYEAGHEAEAMEMELAGRLLEVSNEAELEDFLGSLVRSATSAARGFAGSAAGQALGGVLKNAARQVLPQVGGIVGSALGGSSGGQLGTAAGRWLGSRFELEAMSQEDREFEVARAFVRTAGDAARIAARTPQLPPSQAATQAVAAAARRHLPGLVPVVTGTAGRSRAASGRWVRQGRRIVIYGA
ncbi:hypothetical protein HN031_20730 [Nocardioides sp. zg-1308]|uniref:hypothetical protein n=1 Tax=Nocardioides TaxID=1839 RepID=UPI0015557452|nr:MULTISPECIES: hypothetical protein [unclassified Nocardioides]NPD07109.1 hypothetical protein [Nocardioides sp. zg-1308]WQQ20549.1 hypothetical protein SHK17_11605 [Nocardioides sp. S-34]